MVNPIHNIEGLVSKLLHNENKERHDLARLIIFSKKLKSELVEDSKFVSWKKQFVDEIIRGRRSRVEIDNLRIVRAKREEELVFCKKDVSLVEKIVDLTKKNIGDEERIRNEVKVLFSRVSDDSKKVLEKVFRHVSGEDVLDRKELELELKEIKIFHLVLHFIEKKSDSLTSQNRLLESKALKELHNRIGDEENINRRLIGLLDEVINIECVEKKIEGEKRGLLNGIVSSHSARNIAIVAVLIVLASPFMFKSFNPYAQDSSSVSLEFGSNIFTSKDIDEAKQLGLDVNAKTLLFDSLRQLFYLAKQRCSVEACVLDNSAIDSLLGDNGKIRKAALSASEISFNGNVFSVRSAKPLSAPIPGSLNTATIYLDNTKWGVSENNGNFEFNLLEGSAWLKVNFFGSIGGALFKRGDEKISEMPSIKRALLFKYTKEDGSAGLYGILYDSSGKVKNGIDLSSEDFSSINKIPKADEARVALAFSSK